VPIKIDAPNTRFASIDWSPARRITLRHAEGVRHFSSGIEFDGLIMLPDRERLVCQLFVIRMPDQPPACVKDSLGGLPYIEPCGGES
jgi:hypothetical protein